MAPGRSGGEVWAVEGVVEVERVAGVGDVVGEMGIAGGGGGMGVFGLSGFWIAGARGFGFEEAVFVFVLGREGFFAGEDEAQEGVGGVGGGGG